MLDHYQLTLIINLWMCNGVFVYSWHWEYNIYKLFNHDNIIYAQSEVG